MTDPFEELGRRVHAADLKAIDDFLINSVLACCPTDTAAVATERVLTVERLIQAKESLDEARQKDMVLLDELLGYNSIRDAAKRRGITWAQARCQVWSGQIRITRMDSFWQTRNLIWKTTRLGA